MIAARATVMRAIEKAATEIIERMAREDRIDIPEAARREMRRGMREVSRSFDDGACERLALVPFEQLVADVRAMVEPECRRACAPTRAS